jgi:NADH dehydrogenase
MILITGGTGFIGQVLIRHLIASGQEVRILIRPSRLSPKLPIGMPVEVTVSSLQDERGLRAAMKGVSTVFHLASAEHQRRGEKMLDVDIRGTQILVKAAEEAGIDRFFYLSRIGSDRASAFPVLKSKAIAEGFIKESHLDYTIIRSSVVFGPGDHFTRGLATVLKATPFFFFIPGDGNTLLQPLWVEDLVTCMIWSLEENATRRQVYEVGGGEYIPLRQIAMDIAMAMNTKRTIVPISPVNMRVLTVMMAQSFPGFPLSTLWLDEFAVDRTCPIDSMPRIFGLLPSRFSQRLDYLKGQKWQQSIGTILTKPKSG